MFRILKVLRILNMARWKNAAETLIGPETLGNTRKNNEKQLETTKNKENHKRTKNSVRLCYMENKGKHRKTKENLRNKKNKGKHSVRLCYLERLRWALRRPRAGGLSLVLLAVARPSVVAFHLPMESYWAARKKKADKKQFF